MLNDFVPSLIRTYVPIGIGVLLTWLARHLGVVIDDQTGAQVILFAMAVVTGAYYTAARAVEHAWPALGRVLVSLGLVRAQVSYVRPVPPQSNDLTSRPYRSGM